MTLKLILLRHAKSSWDDPTQDDFDRPLNARGRRSAKAVGAWLRETGHTPEQTLCSSAARTQETYARLGISSNVTFHDSLYHAGPAQTLRVLADHGTMQSVMIVGHNPGLAMLAEELAQPAPRHLKFHQFPTAATLVLTLDAGSWRSISPAPAAAFVTPRELLE